MLDLFLVGWRAVKVRLPLNDFVRLAKDGHPEGPHHPWCVLMRRGQPPRDDVKHTGQRRDCHRPVEPTVDVLVVLVRVNVKDRVTVQVRQVQPLLDDVLVR